MPLLAIALRSLNTIRHSALQDPRTTCRTGAAQVISSNGSDKDPFTVPPAVERKIHVLDWQRQVPVCVSVDRGPLGWTTGSGLNRRKWLPLSPALNNGPSKTWPPPLRQESLPFRSRLSACTVRRVSIARYKSRLSADW